jgi:WD40 repeat protein
MSAFSTNTTDSVRSVGVLKGCDGAILALKWSPDGQRLVGSTSNGSLLLWDPKQQKPRFMEPISTRPVTDVDWNSNTNLLACSTGEGSLEICDAHTLRREHSLHISQSRMNSVATAPKGDRVAIGGRDCNLYVAKYQARDAKWVVQMVKEGHCSAILSVAWSANEATIVSGTDIGNIGVWDTYEPIRTEAEPGTRAELRDFLPGPGVWSHRSSVIALAWSTTTDILASASIDGIIHFWNVNDRLLLRTFDCQEPVFDIAFSPDSQLVVARTRDRLRFISFERMEDVLLMDCPSQAEYASLAVNALSSRVATEDPEGNAIVVWEVDFERLSRNAKVTKRRYHNAKAVVIGERGVGKTNLLLSLTDQPFRQDPAEHGLEVHRLRLQESYYDDGTSEVRDILLWDLPNRHDIIGRVHLTNTDAMILAFDGRADPHALARLANLDQSICDVHCSGQDSTRLPARFLVATKSDRTCEWDEHKVLAELPPEFNAPKIYLTSAVDGTGIGALRNALAAAVDWTTTASVESFENFEALREFVIQEKEKGITLLSCGHLQNSFSRFYATSPPQAVFKAGIQLLENLGALYRFSWGDQILLQPYYFSRYAAALMRGARRDPRGMGRLPMKEAQAGRGEQFELADIERIEVTQERVLLTATIHELITMGLANEVAAHGTNYLVFPSQPTRKLPAVPPKEKLFGVAAFRGDALGIYSSLAVRLLGLKSIFPEPELYDNAAVFRAATGGTCSVVFHPKQNGNEGEIALYFDDDARPLTQDIFTNIIHDHVSDAALADTLTWTRNESWAARSEHDGPARVFLCSEACDQALVLQLVQELKKRNVQPWSELQLPPGAQRSEKNRAMEDHNIAIVAVSKSRLNKSLREDCATLKRLNCRIIPVILPRTPSRFEMPEILRDYIPVDFRVSDFRGAQDFDQLVRGILAAREKNTRTGASAGVPNAEATAQGRRKRERDKGHVFLSYCHDDERSATQLRNELVDAGHTVWWDKEILPGEDWRLQIAAAIQRAYAVILCFSVALERRDRSGVYEEIDEAIALCSKLPLTTVFLIPVLLTSCQVPEVHLGRSRSLSDLQHIELFAPNREHGLQKLLQSLQRAREPKRKAVAL